MERWNNVWKGHDQVQCCQEANGTVFLWSNGDSVTGENSYLRKKNLPSGRDDGELHSTYCAFQKRRTKLTFRPCNQFEDSGISNY